MTTTTIERAIAQLFVLVFGVSCRCGAGGCVAAKTNTKVSGVLFDRSQK